MLTVFLIRVAIAQALAIVVFGALEPDPAQRRQGVLAASICMVIIVLIITLMEVACDYPGH